MKSSGQKRHEDAVRSVVQRDIARGFFDHALVELQRTLVAEILLECAEHVSAHEDASGATIDPSGKISFDEGARLLRSLPAPILHGQPLSTRDPSGELALQQDAAIAAVIASLGSQVKLGVELWDIDAPAWVMVASIGMRLSPVGKADNSEPDDIPAAPSPNSTKAPVVILSPRRSSWLIPLRTSVSRSIRLVIELATPSSLGAEPPFPPTWLKRSASSVSWHQLPERWLHLRYRQHLPAWIANTCLRSASWKQCLRAATQLDHVLTQINDTLLPTIRTAAWKRNAEHIMHELANTVARVSAPLEAVHQELQKSLPKLHDLGQELPPASANADRTAVHAHIGDLIASVQGVLRGFDHIRATQENIQNKILWYFDLVAEENRHLASTRTTLIDAIRTCCTRLDGGTSRVDLSDPTDAAWRSVIAMPSGFLENCLEAMLRNAFQHRIPETTVTISARFSPEGDDLTLRWMNRANAIQLANLANVISGRTPSFGMALATEVAETFFNSRLVVEIDSSLGTVAHTLHLRRSSSSPNAFYALDDLRRQATGSHSG